MAAALAAVRGFDNFTVDNDPYGEHDFGCVAVSEEKVFWKIDYYDLTLCYGSNDPADPAQTARIITIMLAMSTSAIDALRPQIRSQAPKCHRNSD